MLSALFGNECKPFNEKDVKMLTITENNKDEVLDFINESNTGGGAISCNHRLLYYSLDNSEFQIEIGMTLVMDKNKDIGFTYLGEE